MRTPSARSRGWILIGLSIAVAHLIVLSGIALFNHGHLAGDWLETLPWLVIVAMPGVIAGAGLRNPSALPWAAGISFPLALLSLAGATLPLVLPAICYLLGYTAADRASEAAR